MNTIKFFLVIIAFGLKIANAQSLQDVFEQKTMTWYGLDFSQAKFIGSFDPVTTENAAQIRDDYFKSWNAVIINEKDKYDLSKFYDKSSVINDISEVQAINAQVQTDNIMQAAAPAALTKEKIEEVVKKYNPKNKSGLGLVFIVESFDKPEAQGTMDVVFFDIASSKVLMTKRLQGKAAGFGLRNYWARTAYEVMKQSNKDWGKWKKEAGLK
jgi:hypothetical protein